MPSAGRQRAGLGLGLQSQPPRYREDRRLQTEQLAKTVLDELHYSPVVFLVFQQVNLVDNYDDFLAPTFDLFQELPFALSERPLGRGHENHQVAARHKFLGKRLVPLDNGVRARRVYDTDFL